MYGWTFASALLVSVLLYLTAANSNYPVFAVVASTVLTVAILGAGTALPSYLFEKRPIKSWVIHYGYVLTCIAVVSLLMGLFA